ncbi:hypothetical protein F0L74_13890 [Chitinophaga agrisoli]|uniref:Uncharacterized protein n=1 Tax=Chitinophaga agrisoli TaxID=2607653 RepID=A0A5B2VY66_9BACT|nr:hypothetical protein [Chitinophaga agrisoli]KAA2243578.1 hypothetical protein F0L74_13890 [Chitinophaga agrisoli]
MQKTLSTILLSAILLLCIKTGVRAQGCVAIRGSGPSCMLLQGDDEHADKWLFNMGARYFKSYKHFKGRQEQKERVELGTEVINHQTAIDLALTRILNERWSVMIDVPLLANARSSLYEHGLVNGVNKFNQRYSMHSYGLGDIRVAVYRWLLDPKKHTRGNIQAGLGIKFATGDYDYQDYWHNVGPNGAKELRTVDQSIQLGDGGTGLTAELNAYYHLGNKLGVYANGYYLLNPREQNGVRTYRETLTPALANEAICSVPDQYMFRAGAGFTSRNFTTSAGVRLEGIPVNDLVGGSGDFRRPGYVWSVEPAVSYAIKKTRLFVAVPVAFVRNRTQSVTDKERSTPTNKVNGDAAFADYVVNAGFSVKF